MTMPLGKCHSNLFFENHKNVLLKVVVGIHLAAGSLLFYLSCST